MDSLDIKVKRDEIMSDELLIRHCAPTLAGLKTANMFLYRYDSEEEMRASIRRINKKLGPKGLRMVPLRHGNGKALLYLYRPELLKNDLSHKKAEAILEARGYSHINGGGCLSLLSKRVRESEDFPHEIGLFLGYPPEDVEGFIEGKKECSQCKGCWKVYSNPENASKTFTKFRKCRKAYQNMYKIGVDLETLAQMM